MMTTTAQPAAVIRARLIRGAELLGNFWRKNIRCSWGWQRICGCPKPTDFCRGKHLFDELFWESVEFGHRHPDWEKKPEENDPHYVLLLMSSTEFQATRMSIELTHPKLGKVVVGPAGMSMKGMRDFIAMGDEDVAVLATVQRKFPGMVWMEEK